MAPEPNSHQWLVQIEYQHITMLYHIMYITIPISGSGLDDFWNISLALQSI
jgi:hypothetical protein